MKPRPHINVITTLLFMTAVLTFTVGCTSRTGSTGGTPQAAAQASERYPLPDTLRVATLYSPGSYFIYRDTEMGYDYDLLSRFGTDKNITIKLEVAPSLARAVEMLDSAEVDLIAYEVPVTAEYREHVIPCGPVNITSQVLVQPRGRNGKPLITDVTQLAGQEVTVEKDSKYYHRLVNLNDEIGGGIIIREVASDSIITEDLITMMSRDSIGLTIVDSDIARINRTYHPNLDVSLEISFPQRSAWGVAPSRKWLADSVDAWLGQEKPRLAQAELLKRYFEMSKNSGGNLSFSFANGKASPFDDLFRRHAPTAGWDWRLLAAMAYTESHFDASQVSWAGARGMMQIMPQTANAYGVSADALVNNETSVATAVKIIRALDKIFASKVKDKEERRKFVLAAYNAGHAHILDAIALAGKYGLKTDVWDGNVAKAVLMKSSPDYYNDPVCRYGYFRGRETFEYVNQVLSFYNKCVASVKP